MDTIVMLKQVIYWYNFMTRRKQKNKNKKKIVCD
jgi:hypothetical protein